MQIYEAVDGDDNPILRVIVLDRMEALDEIHQTLFMLNEGVWEKWLAGGERLNRIR